MMSLSKDGGKKMKSAREDGINKNLKRHRLA